MPYCPKCGKPAPPKSAYCPVCGTNIPHDVYEEATPTFPAASPPPQTVPEPPPMPLTGPFGEPLEPPPVPGTAHISSSTISCAGASSCTALAGLSCARTGFPGTTTSGGCACTSSLRTSVCACLCSSSNAAARARNYCLCSATQTGAGSSLCTL